MIPAMQEDLLDKIVASSMEHNQLGQEIPVVKTENPQQMESMEQFQPSLSSLQPQNNNLPYTFRAAGSSNNLAELFDLNEIFADEFYPSDLDFSKYLAEADTTAVGGDDWTDINSVPSQDQSFAYLESGLHPSGGNRAFQVMTATNRYQPMNNNNNNNHNNHHNTAMHNSNGGGGCSGASVASIPPTKNEVILIPPSLPRLLPPKPPSSSSSSRSTATGRHSQHQHPPSHIGDEDDDDEEDTAAGGGAGGLKSTRSSTKRHIQDTKQLMPPPASVPPSSSAKKQATAAAYATIGSLHRKPSSSSAASSSYHEPVDYQRYERRERNREHAKRSRVRKKLLLDSLQDQLLALRSQNVSLRRVVTEHCPPTLVSKILSECTTPESSLLQSLNEEDNNQQMIDEAAQGGGGADLAADQATHKKPSPLTSNIAQSILHPSSSSGAGIGGGMQGPTGFAHMKARTIAGGATATGGGMKQSARILMEPDYRLIQSLVTSQQNFVLSDPSLPDNPIVYASEGFCRMTGYKKVDVLGRNCRFLQGPGTDQAAVDLIRQGISEGKDISVCLLNYKADGKAFWNQFFLAALKDAEGQVVNYVGVQCEVNNIPVLEIKDRVKKLPIPADL